MTNEDERRLLAQTEEALVREFQGLVARDQVAREFARIVQDFEAAPVRTFLPLLVARATREQLRESAR